MDGKFITEKQVADLIGKSFNDLEIVLPDYTPNRVHTTGIITIKPGEDSGVILDSVDSTELGIVATAYNIRNITVHYKLTSTFWRYISSLGISVSNLVDIYDCYMTIDCNKTTSYVNGHKKSEISYALQTGEDLEIICDSFVTNRTVEKSDITDATLYIQFLYQTGLNNSSNTGPSLSFEKVDVLPDIGEPNIIYLISNGGEGNNLYDEYYWNVEDGKFELVGPVETTIKDDNPIPNSEIDNMF